MKLRWQVIVWKTKSYQRNQVMMIDTILDSVSLARVWILMGWRVGTNLSWAMLYLSSLTQMHELNKSKNETPNGMAKNVAYGWVLPWKNEKKNQGPFFLFNPWKTTKAPKLNIPSYTQRPGPGRCQRLQVTFLLHRKWNIYQINEFNYDCFVIMFYFFRAINCVVEGAWTYFTWTKSMFRRKMMKLICKICFNAIFLVILDCWFLFRHDASFRKWERNSN